MSVIYSVHCDDCGNELKIRRIGLDNEYDLCITVIPCEKCIELAVEDAQQPQ
jgi:hypothetical protein